MGIPASLLNSLEFLRCIQRGLGLSTGAPAGYLDPYPQVFLEKISYLDL
jgi:hypothetical protein